MMLKGALFSKVTSYFNLYELPQSFDLAWSNARVPIKFIDSFLDHNLFAKELGKYCGKGTQCNAEVEPRYGNYATFEEAAIACSNDTSCQMVMDRYCDNQGPYQLCKSSSVCMSAEGTCSYKKLPGK